MPIGFIGRHACPAQLVVDDELQLRLGVKAPAAPASEARRSPHRPGRPRRLRMLLEPPADLDPPRIVLAGRSMSTPKLKQSWLQGLRSRFMEDEPDRVKPTGTEVFYKRTRVTAPQHARRGDGA